MTTMKNPTTERNRGRRAALTAAALGLAALAFATSAMAEHLQTDSGIADRDSTEATAAKRPYSPYAGNSFPMRPLFGDTHMHTALSLDAGAAGCRLGPREAYRFAKGEEVVSSTGQRVKLARPLDFLAVTDHTDSMGLITDLLAGKPEMLADAQGRRWYDMIQSGKVLEAATELIFAAGQGTLPPAMRYDPGSTPYRTTWNAIVRAAEEANDPGHFTAIIGFEWTSMPGGNNLHRNVLFRDGSDKASQIEPFNTQSPFGSENPRDLWKWMAAYEAKTGGSVLAIPHNGNLSNGRMFPMVEPGTSKPIDREYAEQRQKWERLAEVTQSKGDGETHPLLSPNDEFANFERWDKANLQMSEAKTPAMLEFEYARAALANGLKAEARLGVNPYKFGMVGSTDSHTGLSTSDEENYFGKAPPYEPSPNRWNHPFTVNPALGLTMTSWELMASGYAGVWATENTREAIFDAMKRRETYATTGPRMVVRFFGGWDFTAADAESRTPAFAGYRKGVPMGGELSDAPAGASLTFLVGALKDPIGANLDRVQIVKGWIDSARKTHERIYDVAVSGGRTIGADGRCAQSVGSTVDGKKATWTNTIGAPELIAVWKDPEFDPAQAAFYYARVLEIPTPRWTAYDAVHFGKAMPDHVPVTTVERAYTSPIWYTPRR
jgi:hypothetical protein